MKVETKFVEQYKIPPCEHARRLEESSKNITDLISLINKLRKSEDGKDIDYFTKFFVGSSKYY